MSKFLSHREMKAANRVLGDYQYRTLLLEKIIQKLLQRSELTVAVDEQTEEIELLTKDELAARVKALEAARSKDFEVREIPADEAA